jgi:hypothetical protein
MYRLTDEGVRRLEVSAAMVKQTWWLLSGYLDRWSRLSPAEEDVSDGVSSSSNRR